MNKRRLGQSNLDVSVVGLGTWPIGGARYGQSDDINARQTISAALDAGVTCFDTAPSYGNGHAEALLGKALRGKRDGVILVTKGGLVWNEKSEILGQDGRAEYLESGLNGSLRRLQTDHVDLFLIHWPDKTMPADRTAEALRALLQSGKTRYVGVSNYTGPEFRQLQRALGDVPLIANQVSFHLFDQRWARSSFDTCQGFGASIMAYGSLAHGLLSGAFTRATTFDNSDWRTSGVLFGQPLLTAENRDKNLEIVEQLTEIARSAGMTLPQLALNWVLANPAVSIALVGARTSTEIQEAAGATSGVLTPAQRARIDEVMANAAGIVPHLPA